MFCPKCGKEMQGGICMNCSNEKVLENNVNLNKKSGKKFPIIAVVIIVVIALIAILLGYFMTKKTSSKDIFDKAISYSSNKLNGYIPSVSDAVSETYSFKTELDLNKSIVAPEYYSFINDLEIKGNATVDFKNKLLSMKLSPSYKNESLVDLVAFGTNNNFYISLGELFSKYINIPLAEEDYNKVFEMYSKQGLEDTKTVLNEIEIGLRKSLKEDYFKSEQETLTIDNKEVKTTKHTLVLTEKNTTLLAKDLLAYLNNDKFLDSFQRLIDSSNNSTDLENTDYEIDFSVNTKESINEAIKSLEEKINSNDFTEDETYFLSIFVDSNNSFVSLSFNYVNSEQSEVTLMDIVKLEKGKYSFEFSNLDNLKVLYGTVSTKDKETNLEVYINANNESVGIIKLNIDTLIGTSNTTNISITNSMIGTIKFIVTNSRSNKAEITLPDFSNSVTYEQITEEDYRAMLEKIMQKENVKELITKVEELIKLFNN